MATASRLASQRSAIALLLLSRMVLGSGAAHAAGEKVVVLDLATPGFDEAAGQRLNESFAGILSSSISRLGYDVMSTADVRAMLSLEHQKDLLGCDDASCLSDIGGALGAELVVTGTLAKIGSEFSLSLILLNSRRAEVLQRFEGRAGSPGALGNTIDRGVGILFGKERDTRSTGVILVKTEPPGATVFLDEQEVGTSPLTLDGVSAGEHEVRAQYGELIGTVQLSVSSSAVEKVNILLQTPLVKLKVLSHPPEASVRIDGTYRGTTPLILDDIPSGEHTIRLELDGFVPHQTPVNLSVAAYEQGGKAPLAHEATLHRRMPVVPALAVGAIVDGRDVLAGSAFFAEASAVLSPMFEVGVGMTLPTAVFSTLRFFPYRKGLELGLYLRGGSYFVSASGSDAGGVGGFAGGGAALGISWETPIGLVGARIEGGPNFDIRALRLSYPINAVLTWRLQ